LRSRLEDKHKLNWLAENCAGPNLVMPDKTRYSRIQAVQISALMDKHLMAESVNKRKLTSAEAMIAGRQLQRARRVK